MARGDAKDLFLRKLRLSGVDKYGANAIADRLDALEAGSAASGAPPTPEIYGLSGEIVDTNYTPLGLSNAAPTLLDLTDPTQPVIAADGVYLIVASVRATSTELTSGNQVTIFAETDINGVDNTAYGTLYPSTDPAGPATTVMIQGALSAGMVISVSGRSSEALASGLRGDLFIMKFPGGLPNP